MTPDQFPSNASVVVIGGGIMGCSTLYHLAEAGVSDAVLLERHQLTSGTTWHSAAQVRALRHSHNLTRMIQYSVDLYSRLEQETGQSVGWIQKGSLSIATTADRQTHIRRQEALAHAFGIEAVYIGREEAAERWPLMRSEDILGAVWSPEDGRVSPSDVCAALSKAARRKGARIFENTAVTGIMSTQGRIHGVETTQGTIRCDAVALCSGLWSRELGAMANCDVPLWPCEHFYLLTKPVDGFSQNLPTLSDHDGHLYIRDDSGGLLVGCFEPVGKTLSESAVTGLGPFQLLAEDWDHFEPMMNQALHRVPALHDAEVKMLLNGAESFTPDGMFMLGETAETRGLFLGCGMNSVGIAAGGGAGMNLAHCIMHGRTVYDLGEADARRFSPLFRSIHHLMDRVPEILGSHYDIAFPGKQCSTARRLKQLPLADCHIKANAHFDQLYGWERPVYFNKRQEPELRFGKPDWFDQVEAEVKAAHQSVAVFDSTTLGRIDISGKDAERFLLFCCAGHMSRAPGSVIYSPMLNDQGTYESDITAHRLSEAHYRLFTGSTAIKRDLSRLRRLSDGFDVLINDTTDKYATIALMGPESARIASEIHADDLNSIPWYQLRPVTLCGREAVAARMSYVGEPGWEISCRSMDILPIYCALLDAGVAPAGLYAQTSMRIEKRFCSFGHELDGDITPYDVGLERFARNTGGFIGFEALKDKQAQGAGNRLVSLIFENQNAVPIGHEPVYLRNTLIGMTTSAAYGYRIQKPIALAMLNEPFVKTSSVDVIVAGEKYKAAMNAKAAFHA